MKRGGGYRAGLKKSGFVLKSRFSATIYTFVALMLVSLSLLLISTRSFASDVKDMGLSVFLGVRGGINELTSTVYKTVLSVKELADLRKEHVELLQQITRYEELERSNAEIIQENARLREQLGFARTIQFNYIPAQISGRDPSNLFSALVINKGTYSGVTKDMAVVAFQNGSQALVGKVIQSGIFESLIMPIYDTNSMISSRFSVSRYEGIVEGQGNPDTTLLMRFIQKRARNEISVGDLVVSSGMGGVYPNGINIGRVSNISFREYDITMEVELEPVIDFSRLEYIFLIEPAGAEQ
ncbi:MAG: rod shape-determining protein MreC [Treponema sp.]|nr:rod shape-determining protein MreC [Treponema sp.]